MAAVVGPLAGGGQNQLITVCSGRKQHSTGPGNYPVPKSWGTDPKSISGGRHEGRFLGGPAAETNSGAEM